MFIRPSTILFSVIALAGAVSAAPSTLEARGGGGSSQCDTGSTQCCNQTTDVTSGLVSELASLLGLDLSGITGTVGISCTPILGTGADCVQQPTCCTGNTISGLITVGCSPININL